MSADSAAPTSFDDFALSPEALQGVQQVGYESPSPIQAEAIPHLLAGRDLVGEAQTGTGKTAAFALPIITRLDMHQKQPQVLVLTPTRELAIQVAEAFKTYAAAVPDFHVLPIYGGQNYGIQLRQLKRNPQVIVGTPGRVMDHLRRGTLALESLKTLVLDEADEMLRMGFIEDVEWIMQQTPESRQVALFSATMPAQIRRIAQQYLQNAVEVTIRMKEATAETVRQRYWMVSGMHKLDALTRILEAEPFDAVLIFVRTRNATVGLAEKLEARGFAAGHISGDVQQKQRERTVEQLKEGKLDILVGTDVAARGLDVDRISHVINYDIPYDVEAYIHRIGRTGRAGRSGEAILFVAPRERRLLRAIERGTRSTIEMMRLPTTEQINDTRIERFKQRITDTLAQEEIGFYFQLVEQYRQEHNVPALEIAAALAKLLQGNEPLLLEKSPEPEPRDDRGSQRETGNRRQSRPEAGMVRYRIEVGHDHGVRPGSIVGAIANEGQLDGKHIGKIDIYDTFSLVDLPEGMPKEVYEDLQKARVAGQQLQISKDTGPGRPRKSKGDFKQSSKKKGKRNKQRKDKGKRNKRQS